MNNFRLPPKSFISGPETPNNLSPDLEWMLQSSQVDAATLLNSLLEQYYGMMMSLLTALLHDEITAHELLRQAFGDAALRQHEYRAEYGVRAWLVSLALENFRRARWRGRGRRLVKAIRPVFHADGGPTPERWQRSFDRMKWETRLLLLLHLQYGFSMEEIAWLMKQPVAGLQADLRTTLVYLHLSVEKIKTAASRSSISNIEERLTELLQARWPPRSLSADERAILLERIHEETSGREARQRRTLSLRELLILVGIFIIFLIVMLMAK